MCFYRYTLQFISTVPPEEVAKKVNICLGERTPERREIGKTELVFFDFEEEEVAPQIRVEKC